MKYCIILLIVLPGFFSCNNQDPAKKRAEMLAHIESAKAELLQTDSAFSAMSDNAGHNAAFVKYAAHDATLLRAFAMPLSGKDSIAAFFKAHPDSLYKLKWTPVRADAGGAGDIGYTYGTYTLSMWGLGQEHGTYSTVWKKENGQDWKFVLTSHIQGLKADERAGYSDMSRDLREEQQKDGGKKK